MLNEEGSARNTEGIMFIFDCKECGGRNEVEAGSTYITCAYCGKQITLPTVKDEDRARLFNRANYFRRQGEFDKAIQAFTGIVNQDASDPEATWGRVLARYGIEYVEDPRTGERIPTCNRVSNASILADSDYLATLDNSKDEYTRSLYTKEAERIDKIQKGILAIAKLEEPFDVFICYKESTGGGSRTEDSVLAQDIYDKLTKEGLRVFFSRITLEDKLGQQYEPYIFAALNSAKVMLVVTTDTANVNSVWVKNEWSRYLSIMQSNQDKVLIPCYKKMDVYDLPEELSIYQSQDMEKIGAMQDLIRGVKKICDKGERSVSFHKSAQENISAMLERGFICLRDADFSKADQLFEQVLNLDPHDSNAYLGKLMVERRVCVDDNLAKESELLQNSMHFRHAMEYSDLKIRLKLSEYEEAVKENVRLSLIERLQRAWKSQNEVFIRESNELKRKITSRQHELDIEETKHNHKKEGNSIALKHVDFIRQARIVLILLVCGCIIFDIWYYSSDYNETLPAVLKLEWLHSLVVLSVIPLIVLLVVLIYNTISKESRYNTKLDFRVRSINDSNYEAQGAVDAVKSSLNAAETYLDTLENAWDKMDEEITTTIEKLERKEYDDLSAFVEKAEYWDNYKILG